MASTATVTPKQRTTVWPMPWPASWRASVTPLRISVHSCSDGPRPREHARRHHRRREEAALVEHVDAHAVERGHHHLGEGGVGEPAARESARGLVGTVGLLEGALLPELADEEGRLGPLAVEPHDHGLDVADRGRHDDVRLVGEARRVLEGEGDHAPSLTPGFGGRAAGEDPGPRHQGEGTLHGRSPSQAVSPRPSRIIRSISSETASDRRSSASGSSI